MAQCAPAPADIIRPCSSSRRALYLLFQRRTRAKEKEKEKEKTLPTLWLALSCPLRNDMG